MSTRPSHTLGLLAALLLVATGCDDSPPAAAATAADARRGASIVEMTAVGHHTLEMSTREVPSGWTTLRLNNPSHATHFALVEKLPDGLTLEDWRQSAEAFQALMDAIRVGEPLEPVLALFPEWHVEFFGGPGLASPGETSQATLYLEPGTYVVECYVKTADGQFHSYLGMAEQLDVTDDVSRATEPRATLDLTLSSERGIEVEGHVRPGKHTVSVFFEDQQTYPHFLGHDVHLVRLDDGADLEAVADWMNWMTPGGLADPAPATFVGGAHDMAAGKKAYFDVHLTPGRYAWIAEVPDPAAKGMLVEFTVPVGRPSR